jgi:hypothetical protein
MRRRFGLLLLVAAAAAVAWKVEYQGAGDGKATIGRSLDDASEPTAPLLTGVATAAPDVPGEDDHDAIEPRVVRRTISVLVREVGGAPVAGARVRLVDPWMEGVPSDAVVSGSDGVAEFERVPFGAPRADGTGAWRVRAHVTAAGFAEGRLNEDPDASTSGEPLHFLVRLVRAVTLSGRVVAARDGTPIAAASVVASWYVPADVTGRTTNRYPASCDAEGRFTIPNVPTDRRVVLRASASGHMRDSVSLLDAARSEEVQIALEETGVARGIVLRPDGSPAARARVYLVDHHAAVSPGNGFRQWEAEVFRHGGALADEGGRFVLREIDAPCRARLVASDGERLWGATSDHDFTSEAPGPEFEIRLEERTTLVVRVRGVWTSLGCIAPSIYISGSRRLLGDPPVRGTWRHYVEGPQTARIRGLTPGEYLLEANVVGSAPVSHRVVIDGPGEIEVLLRPTPGIDVSGRVEDEAGAPLAGADVSFRRRWDADGPGQDVTASTDAQGGFVLRGLTHLAGELRIAAAGRSVDVRSAFVPDVQPLRIVLDPLPVVRGKLRPWTPFVGRSRLRVLVAEGSASEERVVEVGEDGSFSLPLERSGVVSAVLLPEDAAAVEVGPLQLAHGAKFDLGTLDLVPGRTLRGRVVGADDQGVQGVDIQACSARLSAHESRAVLRRAETRAGGHFEVAGLPLTPVVLQVSPYSYVPVDVLVPADGSEVLVHLTRAASIRGVVVGGSNLSVAGAKLVLRRADPAVPEEHGASVDATGEFWVGRLPPGRYRAFVRHEDLRSELEMEVIDLAGGEERVVRWRLP